jgi:hypothetical protein
MFHFCVSLGLGKIVLLPRVVESLTVFEHQPTMSLADLQQLNECVCSQISLGLSDASNFA